MNDSVRQLAGEVITTGIPGPRLDQPTWLRLERVNPSGIILFRRNIENVAQLRHLIAELHSLPSHPLVSIDHEGEPVARLGDPFTIFPPAASIGATGAPTLACEVGRAMGIELASVGIDINFAPVLDIHSNPHNPVIGNRAFASSPADVASYATAFFRGLIAGGVLPCGKHFPGHGHTDRDSHTELPVVTRSPAEIDATELYPFRAAVAAGIPMLMSAHVLYPALDQHHPATLSRIILHDVLRQDVRFHGVVVSDDLAMRAVSGRVAIEEVALASLQAGVDWLLVCSGLDESLRVADRLAAAIVSGELDAHVPTAAAERIRALPVPPRQPAPSTLPIAEHQALNRRIRTQAADEPRTGRSNP